MQAGSEADRITNESGVEILRIRKMGIKDESQVWSLFTSVFPALHSGPDTRSTGRLFQWLAGWMEG